MAGQLAYVFLIAILDAAILSWLALRWYGHSVGRLMSSRVPPLVASGAAAPSRGAQARDERTSSVPFTIVERTVPAMPESTGRLPGDARRRLVAAYGAGAAAYSAIVTALELSGSSEPLPLVAWFILWWVNAWPIVPTLIVVLALDRRASLRLALGYIGAGAVIQALITLAGQAARGAFSSAALTNVFWFVSSLAIAAGPLVPLLLVSGPRRVRAVTPLALAATLLFGFASLLVTAALVRAFDVNALGRLFLALPGSGSDARDGLFLLISLPVGWLAWRLLTTLARAYAGKRFSDIQLTVDCWWFIVACFAIATSAGQRGLAGIALTLTALAAYRVSVALVLRLWVAAPVVPRRLLLLRVFGFQARTEALFDRLAQRWRFFGPVQMIAGVDLAMRTADAGDMLAFIGGRLGDQYVTAPADAAAKLAGLDQARDPDGRFRINEVFCHDDTWRPALLGLLDTSDIVLMDLRSFNQTNAGCIFEIEQLIQRAGRQRTVLVYGASTDVALLGRVVGAAWAAAGSGTGVADAGEVAMVRIDSGSSREIAVVAQSLLAAGPAPVVLLPAPTPAV
jgi:hypothetical protein